MKDVSQFFFFNYFLPDVLSLLFNGLNEKSFNILFQLHCQMVRYYVIIIKILHEKLNVCVYTERERYKETQRGRKRVKQKTDKQDIGQSFSNGQGTRDRGKRGRRKDKEMEKVPQKIIEKYQRRKELQGAEREDQGLNKEF